MTPDDFTTRAVQLGIPRAMAVELWFTGPDKVREAIRVGTSAQLASAMRDWLDDVVWENSALALDFVDAVAMEKPAEAVRIYRQRGEEAIASLIETYWPRACGRAA